MFPFRVAAVLLVFVITASAFRVKPKKSNSNSSVPYDSSEWTMVDNLYTFGAPMATQDAVRNPIARNGCFKGFRTLQEGEPNKVDLVVTLLTFNGFKHPSLPAYRVSKDRSSREHGCGWVYNEDTRRPTTALHDMKDYVSLSRSKLGAVATLALDNSYNLQMSDVAKKAKNAGWGLVDTVLASGSWLWWKEDEVSHLFQDPNTLDCMLTFEGSTSVSNWMDNINFIKTSFCGLPGKVHRGFVNAMRVITQSSNWRNKILPKLPFCRKVSVVGHSLGGAISTLFSACANNKYFASNDSDNKDVTWTKKTPKRLSYK